MDLSVIIATHDAADTLGHQLEALVAQDARPLEWEVVVVDNRSTDDPAAIVAEYAATSVPIRLLEAHELTGAGYARNVGAAVAEGRRLAFCDADDVVAPGWVTAIHAAIASEGFVAGALDYEELNPSWARSSRGRVHDGAPLLDGVVPVASSCNLGVDARLFATHGGFDNTFQGAEDAELSVRLWRAGQPAAYAPAAVVHYRLRHDLRSMFRQSRTYGRARAALSTELAALPGPPCRATDSG